MKNNEEKNNKKNKKKIIEINIDDIKQSLNVKFIKKGKENGKKCS